MPNPLDDENGEFLVLINHELQYSLWPTFCAIPAGWQPVGPRGSRTTCLKHIEEEWTDMRPKSLIDEMDSDRKEAREH